MHTNISNPLMETLFKKYQRYLNMRDNELEEKNYSKAAAMNEIAHGINLAMDIVDKYLDNNEIQVDKNIDDSNEDDLQIEKDFEDSNNNFANFSVASLFSTQNSDTKGARTEIDKIAATTPPSNKKERSEAILRKSEQKIPEPYKDIENNPKLKKFISDSNSFYEAVLNNKNKKSNIDVESITNPRQRAVAEEQRAMEESIGIPAYIVNEKYASLQINDLGISLPKDGPIDLSRYSAKKLFDSRDLKSIIENNMIKFITPNEASEIVSKSYGIVEKDEDTKTFSSYKEAQRYIEDDGDYDETSDKIDLEGNLDIPTEQEEMAGLINLTPQAPQSGIRKTVHGGSVSKPPLQQNDGKISKQQHRSIRRVDD